MGRKKKTKNYVLRIPEPWQDMQKQNRARTLVVSRAGSEKKWCGSNTYKPNGEWDDVAEHVLLNFGESGHPVFRGTSALERGTLKSKGGGKLSIHFCGDPQIVEVFFALLFPSISSVFTEQ